MLKLSGDYGKLQKAIFAQIISDKINEKMSRNLAKLGRTINFDICFCVIFDH